jgi:uncharacterized cofD-like protein
VKSNKKIVVIGGGTGVFTVLSGIKKYFNNPTAIVTTADDGGSAGILREEFGILPPGDIRRALLALSSSDKKILSQLFGYRFDKGSGLSGHSFGNLMITALERITGNFEEAISEAGKLLGVEGKVIPVTLKKISLVAELEDGRLIKGEANIDVPKHDGALKIKKVWLEPDAPLNPAARKAVLEADAIILGPGDLYTSLVPNLLVKGMKQALAKARGKKIYFVNLMTKFGETTGFRASDFVGAVENYLGKNILDYAVVNKTKPSPMRFRPYAEERAQFVEADLENVKRLTPIVVDLVRKSGFIRHDSEKVAKIIQMLV